MRTERVDGVLIAAPQGALNAADVEEIDGLLAAQPEVAILVDLSDCVLDDIAVVLLAAPAMWSAASEQLCVVCSRMTGRLLLARVGLTERVALFGRREDALQARVLHAAGYGAGWRGS